MANIEGVSEAAADGWRADRKWEGLVERERERVEEETDGSGSDLPGECTFLSSDE